MSTADSSPLFLVTMLGNGDYKSVTYRFRTLAFETELFPEAVTQWYKPSQVLVLATQSVLDATDRPHLQRLAERLRGQCPVSPIPIPDGRSEAELWKIFSAMIDRLPQGSRVVLDVTHGFRSLPMVALLAALYLRQSDRVDVEQIVYGAWEARDPATNTAPVFDLTPFLEMANWMSAANVFLKTGHGGLLSDLLKQTQQSAWRSPDATEVRPKELTTLASNLNFMSEAMLMTRVNDVSRTAGLVASSLERAATELQEWALPFAPMVERLQSLTNVLQQPGLDAQRHLLHWYLEHGHIVQCVTLAREWLISLVQALLGVPGDVNEARHQAEMILGRSLAGKRNENSDVEPATLSNGPHPDIGATLAEFQKLPQRQNIESAWSRLADLRNDVAHCGMRKQPRSTSAIRKLLGETMELLDQLSLPPSLPLASHPEDQ